MHFATRTSYVENDGWKKYQPLLPPWARLTAANLPSEEWWSWQGADIHLDRYPRADSPLTVLLFHGAGGYGRMLSPYGIMLQEAGYEVVAPDWPGYGLTVAPTEMFSYQKWVDCAADLVLAEVKRGRPVVMFGLSVGGYLAYQAAAKSRAASGVMVTTLADPRVPLVRTQFARNRFLAWIGPALIPVMAFFLGNRRLPVRWLTRMSAIANDPALIALINSDPLGGGNRLPISFPRSVLDMQPVLEPEAFDLCPVLFAQPMADTWTTLEASKPFFDRIKAPKEFVRLENCGHFPLEEPGVSQLREAMCNFLAKIAKKA